MRGWWLMLAVALLAGCDQPPVPDAGDYPTCPATQVRWIDPSFAAGFANLTAGERSSFRKFPGLDAGSGPSFPQWPLDGNASIVRSASGDLSVYIQVLQTGETILSLGAPDDSTPEQRRLVATAFLDAVDLQPAGRRDGIVEHLATQGGLQHTDPGPTGEGYSQWYSASQRFASGKVTASIAGLVPDVLQNRTDPALNHGEGVPSSVEFSRDMDGFVWSVGVALPQLTLALDGTATVTVDSLGTAIAWDGGEFLAPDDELRAQVLAAFVGAGLEGGRFDSWEPYPTWETYPTECGLP